MTAERPRFENYPGVDSLDPLDEDAAGGGLLAANTGPPGVVAPPGKRGSSRRGVIGNVLAAAIGTGAVAAIIGGPFSMVGLIDDDEAYANSVTYTGLEVGEYFIEVGASHSVQIADGWLAEATGPASATLGRGDNRLSLWTFELSGDSLDAARELRAAVKRLGAVPKGATLSSLETSDGLPDAYAGGAGAWRGKPVQMMVELSIRHGHALLTSFWLTDGLGSKAFRDGYLMMTQAHG